MNIKKILPLTAFAVLALAPYVTSGQTAPRPIEMSYEEASAFEVGIIVRGSNAPTPKAPENLYIQPANKAEACKVPTTQDLLNRPNIQVYWDGECKNGFAFGLGRNIAISDTYHLDEITILDGDNWWSRPRVFYDYVNNIVAYRVGGSKFPAGTTLNERMVDSISGFNAYQDLTVVDEFGKVFAVQSSAFESARILWNSRIDNAIAAYRFSDNLGTPVTDQNAATFMTEILDPKSNTAGMAVVHYANGATRQFKISDGKTENVLLPAAYIDHLYSKYQEIVNATSQANANLQSAQQIEREYLFKACNGKSGIKGLDNSDYTKICTWRDQFKERYAVASANYQRQLESLKQQATTAEQQRQIQQQIAQQQQMLQQQRNQQAWNEANQRSQQQTQQLVPAWQPQVQPFQVQPWVAPQVQPIAPPGGNRIICNTIGSITTCR